MSDEKPVVAVTVAQAVDAVRQANAAFMSMFESALAKEDVLAIELDRETIGELITTIALGDKLIERLHEENSTVIARVDATLNRLNAKQN